MDNRVRVETTKLINLEQLDRSLGSHGLCGSDTEIVAVEGSPVTEKQLRAAINAHVYVDPQAAAAQAKADAVAHALSLGFTDEMIAVMYPGLIVP